MATKKQNKELKQTTLATQVLPENRFLTEEEIRALLDSRLRNFTGTMRVVSGTVSDGGGSTKWELSSNEGVLIGEIGLGTEPSIQGWQQTMTFSAIDDDTVSWTTGTISLADGTTYSIATGNTGNMAAITYIYLSTSDSTTVLQTSTTAGDAVGSGKIIIAVAQNNDDATSDAIFQVFGGRGGALWTTENIAANSVTANEITVNNLAAISADLGVVTAGSIALGSNAWHVDTSGNMWWGNFSTYAAATIKISAAGAVDFTTGDFSGTVTVGPSAGIQAIITGAPGYGVITLKDDDTDVEASFRMTADDDPTYPNYLQVDADDGQIWKVGGTALVNIESTLVALIGSSKSIYPNTDDGWKLGDTNKNFIEGHITTSYIKGHTTRTGTGGSFGANKFNLNWTGSATELYIDATDTGDITVTSDRRLKKNIKKLDSSSVLDKISQFEPVAYEFKHGRKQQRYGMIAQDVEKICPELVRTLDIESKEAPDGIKIVDYHSVISMLVSSVQELNDKVEKLTDKLNNQ